MSTPHRPAGEPIRSTVIALVRMSRRRAKGRAERQQQLLNSRRKRASFNYGRLFFPLLVLWGLFLHGFFAMATTSVVWIAYSVESEFRGRLVVDHQLERLAREFAGASGRERDRIAEQLDRAIRKEARDDSRRADQSAEDRERQIREHLAEFGPAGFESGRWLDGMSSGPSAWDAPGLPQAAGLLLLAWWFVMLAFQGEGLDLDVQRRRHPMWEWVLSHPVKPGAVFFAEMVAPLAANPNLILAPIFWTALLAFAGNPFGASALAGTAIGVPLAVAAACVGKSIEVAALMRLAPRNRGAILGLVSWIGFVATMLPLVFFVLGGAVRTVLTWLRPLTGWIDAPVFGWLVGTAPGFWKFGVPVAAAWTFSIAAILLAVRFSAHSTEKGLSGVAEDAPRTTRAFVAGSRPLGDPLYRKELLWFWRDRGAVVQAVLIPMSVAAFQLVNFRFVLAEAAGQWHWLCALAIVFGTYFLFVLGPRSLVSEGSALWIPLTWPRGMESLLKAKARLWWALSCIPVGIGLAIAAIAFPSAWWRIALVGAGWWFFSRSLALKSVTLVQAPSSSSEAEPIPLGRRAAAWLGTFTFASGVATQQWHLAAIGVVYSWVTAAAMWQNFRARLPFLFDPWSERVPPPPTVMHAMIAIFLMVEMVAVISSISIAAGGRENLSAILAIAYGATAVVIWLATRAWLQRNGVSDRDIWRWNPDIPRNWRGIPAGLTAGVALGAVAVGYLATLPWWWNDAAETARAFSEQLAGDPAARAWYGALVVVAAPLAEEYLFRGLLFRSLDREWGGWRAVVVSAAFFASYHPVVSWLPVFALGILTAWLFRRTGNLWTCVAAHSAYNLVLVLA